MKSATLQKDFPASPADWDKLISDAPGDDRPSTPAERAEMDKAEVFTGGGVKAFIAQRRRGAGRSPLKVPTTIRFDADVLAALKASGKGWQTRVNDAMRDWLKTHSPA